PEVGVKIRRSKKAATKARTIISPFNGEEIHVPAKPARTTVKVTALKALKETVL
ncbi:DNA-binding protein, partial [Bacillus halotolerans]